MQPKQNASLKNYTTLNAGGNAELLLELSTTANLQEVLAAYQDKQKWFLGYGANTLVSDEGLPGLTLVLKKGSIFQAEETLLIADAGTNWDELVEFAISKKLWGLELMSGIPGGVGAAVVGNIAAYGQAVKDTLAWTEAYNTETNELVRFLPDQLGFTYRFSNFKNPDMQQWLITKAAFRLSKTQQKKLAYASSVTVANELKKDLGNINQLREIILETRRRGGSLLDENSKSAGSFFKNPLVSFEQADEIASFDETGKSKEIIHAQHAVHGGEATRVSAALVLLAAGFKRGQTWGPVRLHPDHVLKIENTGGATAQQIYDVAHEIMRIVEQKLGIKLEPEVKFLGEFN